MFLAHNARKCGAWGTLCNDSSSQQRQSFGHVPHQPPKHIVRDRVVHDSSFWWRTSTRKARSECWDGHFRRLARQRGLSPKLGNFGEKIALTVATLRSAIRGARCAGGMLSRGLQLRDRKNFVARPCVVRNSPHPVFEERDHAECAVQRVCDRVDGRRIDRRAAAERRMSIKQMSVARPNCQKAVRAEPVALSPASRVRSRKGAA